MQARAAVEDGPEQTEPRGTLNPKPYTPGGTAASLAPRPALICDPPSRLPARPAPHRATPPRHPTAPQAMDRVHRIGQTKPVHVYRLATAHSVVRPLPALRPSGRPRVPFGRPGLRPPWLPRPRPCCVLPLLPAHRYRSVPADRKHAEAGAGGRFWDLLPVCGLFRRFTGRLRPLRRQTARDCGRGAEA